MPLWIFPLSLLVIFEVIADIFAKNWSLKERPLIWLAAIGSYVVANIFWLFALRQGAGLARGALIFSVATAIAATLLGLVLYHESVNKIQIVGMAIGILSLVLIFW